MRRVRLAATAGFVVALCLAGSASGETSPDVLRSQAKALRQTAAVLFKQGKNGEALAAIRQARDIFRNLVAGNPDCTDCQIDLATGDVDFGDVLQAQRDLTGALAAYRDSHAIVTTLAQKDPNDRESQRALAIGDIRSATRCSLRVISRARSPPTEREPSDRHGAGTDGPWQYGLAEGARA